MVNALDAFGLAIGCMDILCVLCFELIMFYMMRRRRLSEEHALPSPEEPLDHKKPRTAFPKLLSRKNMMESENTWIFWGYLLMLNLWIMVTLLMIAGITMHKPELMTFYLSWCFCGLVMDIFFILWWVLELFVGNTFVAATNILISLLTLAVELGFVLVIYAIYLNLLGSANVPDIPVPQFVQWLMIE